MERRWESCDLCRGSGVIDVVRHMLGRRVHSWIRCRWCCGTGLIAVRERVKEGA